MMEQRRKYVFVVGDGMGDYPLEELNGKTPLEAAETPNMDRIASCHMGTVPTIPKGMEPGSDVANLCLMGYNPAKYHTGRAPLEAASIGVDLDLNDIAFRMNLVSIDKKDDGRVIMLSHSGGDISTPEARNIVKDLAAEFGKEGIRVFPGIAYRHLFVWHNAPEGICTIAPHDYLERDVSGYLASQEAACIYPFIEKSWEILKNHEVNVSRCNEGRLPANSIWLWGQGKKPSMPLFRDCFGLRGGMISAVDLLNGMGLYLGLELIHVEGATGDIHTNFKGKGQEAIKALDRLDFIFVHVEAPDEAGHAGKIYEKIKAIEYVDNMVLGTILDGLDKFDDYRIMVASDHYTPIYMKTHSSDPSLFAMADKAELKGSASEKSFNEKETTASGVSYNEGYLLLKDFLGVAGC